MTKSVLSAIAGVLPDDNHNYVTKFEIGRGWGNVLNIRLQTTISSPDAGRELGDRLRHALGEALADERHHVEIVWVPAAEHTREETSPTGDLRP